MPAVGAAAAQEPLAGLAHLPPGSAEAGLASLADLHVTLAGGPPLPLHSSVLAAQSPVLCAAFAATGRKGWGGAVEAALAGAPAPEAALFLRLLYCGGGGGGSAAVQAAVREADAGEAGMHALRGALRMAHRLDVLSMQEAVTCAALRLPCLAAAPGARGDGAAKWLGLAVALGLPELRGRAAAALLSSLACFGPSGMRRRSGDWARLPPATVVGLLEAYIGGTSRFVRGREVDFCPQALSAALDAPVVCGAAEEEEDIGGTSRFVRGREVDFCPQALSATLDAPVVCGAEEEEEEEEVPIILEPATAE